MYYHYFELQIKASYVKSRLGYLSTLTASLKLFPERLTSNHLDENISILLHNKKYFPNVPFLEIPIWMGAGIVLNILPNFYNKINHFIICYNGSLYIDVNFQYFLFACKMTC